MQENFNLFLENSQYHTSGMRGMILFTFSFVRIPESTRQNISTLKSNTCGTGLTALRLRHRHRYWLMACTNEVASWEVLETMTIDGSTIKSMCELRIVKTMCSESSLDLIA